MGQIDAMMMIGIGLSLFGLGVAAYLGSMGWLSLKKFERDSQRHAALQQPDPDLETRMGRIEQIVEATAIEVERIAESQRYLTRTLTDQNNGAVPRLEIGGGERPGADR